MSRLPWLVGLGGGAALYVWSRNRAASSRKNGTSSPEPARSAPDKLEGRWVWPVASWRGRPPTISDGFDSPRTGYPRHGGVDVMFARTASDAAFKPGTPNASKGGGFVMPEGVHALAASDGIVWSAMQTPQGFAVVIDHGKRGPHAVATFYTHLDKLFVQPTSRSTSKERVSAGQAIGTIGFSPLDGEKLRHLHFETWLGAPSDRIDPARLMRTWQVVEPTPPVLVARNGGMTYRPVGGAGEPYPQWVRDLDGRSGVYFIRDARSHELLYIGSSMARLYDTVTRHFQRWRRYKRYWSGQYSEGHDPGLTYDRARVEVAIRFTSPDEALDEEARHIARMHPRDNVIGQASDEDDEPPF